MTDLTKQDCTCQNCLKTFFFDKINRIELSDNSELGNDLELSDN